MTTYSKITDYAAKDALLTGNPSKIVKGVEIGAEFDAIATADASNVKGPTVAVTDNALMRWDGTAGRDSQGSSATLADDGTLTATKFSGALNGTVGATTPSTGAFTTLSSSGVLSFSGQDSYFGSATRRTYWRSDSNGVSLLTGAAQTGSGVYFDTANNKVQLFAASASRAEVTSTGLAVTGALSATGSATFGTNATIGGSAGDIFYADATNTAIKAKSAGGGVYIQNSAGSTQAVIDTAGNLGLGVTPNAWSAFKAIEINRFGIASTGTETEYLHNGYWNGTSWIYKATDFATRMRNVNGQFQFFTAPSGTAGNAITFTQAMTLDASGNLRVNFATAPGKITADGGDTLYGGYFTNGAAASNCIAVHNRATTGDNAFAVFATEASLTSRGSIDYNRAGGLTRYNTTSDYRAKDVYGLLNDSGETIDALKVYRGKMHGATMERPMLIAHEAQEIAPYAVTGEKDAVNEDGTPKFQQMDTSSLVPLLIAEIQSLRSRVAALEAK